MIYSGIDPHQTDNEQDDWLGCSIFIPVPDRGRPLATLSASVRLSNIFEHAKLRLLGDLHGKSYLEIGRYRNCGRKTLQELRGIVRQIQLGNSEDSIASEGTSHDPNIISVTPATRDLLLKELPMSVRLENVLSDTCGYKTVGDLHGCDVQELLKLQNCGRQTISELKELLRRAEKGEFIAPRESSSTDSLGVVLQAIGLGMRKVNQRDHDIVKQRLFGSKGEPKTLEEVGERFGMMRERVRQIVKNSFEKVRRSGD